ncbi:hypothetical protein NPIL_140441 [Nephila pilipes]|uniref:PiggyBac transposable element-derived protein domain-containing protein n=1 Tax=Nephila pilipes TaxID=299642 RepID=A0A8X6PIB9_NEPPI|nr:hypothetical protein NPIL_140441 [Nephila pilipes]
MLLCDSDDDEDIVLDESGTDEEEPISEREDHLEKTKRAPRNICIRVPAVIGRAKDYVDILDIFKCLITDYITESIVEGTNNYICSVTSNYTRSRDARNTDGAKTEALLGLLYLADVYHGNRVNIEKLWRMD